MTYTQRITVKKINKHEGFSVFCDEAKNWYYTTERVEPGTFRFDLTDKNGRWWASNARKDEINTKQLSIEFRERVKSYGKER